MKQLTRHKAIDSTSPEGRSSGARIHWEKIPTTRENFPHSTAPHPSLIVFS
jgi:hypothetical protein